MKTFKVVYKEVLVHEFEVDAESIDKVEKEFMRMANEGELDFGNANLEDSGIVSIEDTTIQN